MCMCTDTHILKYLNISLQLNKTWLDISSRKSCLFKNRYFWHLGILNKNCWYKLVRYTCNITCKNVSETCFWSMWLKGQKGGFSSWVKAVETFATGYNGKWRTDDHKKEGRWALGETDPVFLNLSYCKYFNCGSTKQEREQHLDQIIHPWTYISVCPHW